MSIQDRAQHSISQLDKEVCQSCFVSSKSSIPSPPPSRFHCWILRNADIFFLQLSKYPALANFEKQTSVPKVYVVLGLGALYFFLVFFNIAANFLVNTIGFAIPAYYSLDALFTSKSTDDTQVSLSVPKFYSEHAILTN
jgi:hypothetical protein